jgi:hypothetical protein
MEAKPLTNPQKNKVCKQCGKSKPLTLFRRHSIMKDGFSNKCKECTGKRDKLYEATHKEQIKESYVKYDASHRLQRRHFQNQYYAAHKEQKRNSRLKQRFGIDAEEYQRLLTKQMDGCAICGTTIPGGPGKRNPLGFAVDHDHKTGKVRGLLCRNCNTGIGLLKDKVSVIRNAVDYVERYANEGRPSQFANGSKRIEDLDPILCRNRAGL